MAVASDYAGHVEAAATQAKLTTDSRLVAKEPNTGSQGENTYRGPSGYLLSGEQPTLPHFVRECVHEVRAHGTHHYLMHTVSTVRP
jgi:hypothetical protein